MKTRIYLDNAATTPLAPEVLQAMMPYFTEQFGNPSSVYSYGRETRLAVEQARKTVAKLLGVRPATIFFTSGGTESNNTVIAAAVRDLGCTHLITSPIEHHAVLHTVEHYTGGSVTSATVRLDGEGAVDFEDLEQLLQKAATEGRKILVSLMHANNEIGILLDMERTGNLCHQYGAYFHSDCVQTVGHYPLDLSKMPVDFISAAGHKFHGPKGTGMLYVREEINIKPFIFGGGQERNMRAGTENVYGIVGFAKALELAMEGYATERPQVEGLRNYMKEQLQQRFSGLHFNGGDHALYSVLSVCFPKTESGEYLLMNLDMAGVCASGGSACSSGADAGSHVMQALGKSDQWTTVRFSFSRYTTKEEIDQTIKILEQLLAAGS